MRKKIKRVTIVNWRKVKLCHYLYCKYILLISDRSSVLPLKLSFHSKSYDEIYNEHGLGFTYGGQYRRCDCHSSNTTKTAIIVPHSGPEKNLRIFLNNIIPFLKMQKIHFRIFIIEQVVRIIISLVPDFLRSIFLLYIAIEKTGSKLLIL